MKVLVATDSRADDRKTLAAVRSLAAAGARVTLGGDRHDDPVFRDPAVAATVCYPHPAEGTGPFLEALERHLGEGGHDVLLPLSDDTTAPAVEHRTRLLRLARLPVPGPRSYRRARDKLRTLALARRLGIGIPRTSVVRDPADLLRHARRVGFPCVQKPRRGSGGEGFRILEAPPSAAAAVRAGDLLQEFVPGEVHDLCALFARGEVRAALTQRRILMDPPTGGPGVAVETTDEPALRDRGLRLLRALRWHGPAQVEFKIDSRDGEPRLMEVNGRWWGTLGASIAVGLDLPVMACRLALLGDVEPRFHYRVGERWEGALRPGWKSEPRDAGAPVRNRDAPRSS